MASFRRKYQFEHPAKDGPPVTTVPNETAAQPPPVVDAKPPEPPVAEPSPADEAAKTALRQRLQEMENAEALQREAAVARQHPQLAIEPQEQQMPTAEEIIEGSGLPENAKDWLRRYPDTKSKRKGCSASKLLGRSKMEDERPFVIESPTRIKLRPAAREWARQHGMTEERMAKAFAAARHTEAIETNSEAGRGLA